MYTGRHLQNKKVIKHSKTSEYYIISHPKEVNLKTGNACIKIKDIERYDKNFIFQYYDENFKLKTILIGRRQVCENLFILCKNDKDESGNIISHHYFYGIKIKDIFKFGKEIEL